MKTIVSFGIMIAFLAISSCGNTNNRNNDTQNDSYRNDTDMHTDTMMPMGQDPRRQGIEGTEGEDTLRIQKPTPNEPSNNQ